MEREVKTYVLKRSDDEAAPRKLSIDYAAELNSQQLAAVTAVDGPALVIAGAGSGKTRTLVYRVAYLIDKGVDPTTILLLTFTRKASQEMLQRAGVLIGARSERVAGGRQVRAGDDQRPHIVARRQFGHQRRNGAPHGQIDGVATGGVIDQQTGDAVVELLLELCRETGTALVLVTHNLAHAAKADRPLFLHEGVLRPVASGPRP